MIVESSSSLATMVDGSAPTVILSDGPLTVHNHVWLSVPFTLVTLAVTFQYPITALKLVYFAVYILLFVPIFIPSRYHVTFDIWSVLIWNSLCVPSKLKTGVDGE